MKLNKSKKFWKKIGVSVMGIVLCASIVLPCTIYGLPKGETIKNNAGSDNNSSQTEYVENGELQLIQDGDTPMTDAPYLTVSELSPNGVYGLENSTIGGGIIVSKSEGSGTKTIQEQIWDQVIYGDRQIYTVTLEMKSPSGTYSTQITVASGSSVSASSGTLTISGTSFTFTESETLFNYYFFGWKIDNADISTNYKITSNITITSEYNKGFKTYSGSVTGLNGFKYFTAGGHDWVIIGYNNSNNALDDYGEFTNAKGETDATVGETVAGEIPAGCVLCFCVDSIKKIETDTDDSVWCDKNNVCVFFDHTNTSNDYSKSDLKKVIDSYYMKNFVGTDIVTRIIRIGTNGTALKTGAHFDLSSYAIQDISSNDTYMFPLADKQPMSGYRDNTYANQNYCAQTYMTKTQWKTYGSDLWWLRSGELSVLTKGRVVVNATGEWGHTNITHSVDDSTIGARPAFVLNLN